ncbi:MAG: TonB-dependent receptor [Desulfovermiculus sp.]|nr:TonB-dependent receptor [Desulfovermiculus sp.]
MQVEVTSVAKSPQQLVKSAAAVYVITCEDIRRSGVTSIPEALRLAPGVQVARVDASKWAVSIRGFNNLFAKKLLVLIDGRTVYNSLFSGVIWDVQDTMLEDIDRIEIIRGPGATLWGANAVNGVINIITKSSADTQGGLVTAGMGTEERGFGSLRYGGQVGQAGTYRVYAKYFNRDAAVDAHGDETWDDWDMVRAGFRSDLEPSSRTSLTIQGDIYSGQAGNRITLPSFTPPYSQVSEEDMDVDGGNLLLRSKHTFSDQSELELQAYYDRADRELFMGDLERETLDLELQHHLSLGSRNDLLWGLRYRHVHHNLSMSIPDIIHFSDRSMHLVSGFIQDELTLVPDTLKLILGSKFEHNDFTGFEVQPNARMIWTPHPRHTLWAAVSRAVRTPSRDEHDVTWLQAVLPPEQTGAFLPTAVRFKGDNDVDSENLMAYELGYRLQWSQAFSLDLALFYNRYDDHLSYEIGEPSLDISSATLNVPVHPDNTNKATTYGGEVVLTYHPLDWWEMEMVSSLLEMDFDASNSSTDKTSQETYEGRNPNLQFSLRSNMNLPHDLELDLWCRFVDRLEALDISDYTTLDARLGWRPSQNLEVALVGRNLLKSRHKEFRDEHLNLTATQIERSAYLQVTFQF